MILRMTVNDNDYQDLLQQFAQTDFICNLIFPDYKYSECSQDVENIFTRRDKMMKLIKYCSIKSLPDTDTRFIIQEIKNMWAKYVPLCFIEQEFTQQEVKALIKDFQVDVISSFEEKDENGEVLYYFTVADTFIIQ